MSLDIFSTDMLAFSYCTNQKNCIKFPCNHLFCADCYYLYFKPKIERLSKIATSRPDLINGTCSYIGCPEFCSESALTISPHWLRRFFLDRNDRENAANIAKYCTFLSGIPTYFKFCDSCNTSHCAITENVICPQPKIQDRVITLNDILIENNLPFIACIKNETYKPKRPIDSDIEK